ncbi:MAG TPA: RDD family protein [Thermoanaerobaculia bacterium]|nr:RDD family protein [Thermoanaerobaculia bacterium]
MLESSQTLLLRVAAFLADALMISIILIIPASAVSYGMAWFAGSERVQIVWFVALGIFLCFMLLRDGYRGRSPGKHLLGLRVVTPTGDACSYFRSAVRNLPIALPHGRSSR